MLLFHVLIIRFLVEKAHLTDLTLHLLGGEHGGAGGGVVQQVALQCHTLRVVASTDPTLVWFDFVVTSHVDF